MSTALWPGEGVDALVALQTVQGPQLLQGAGLRGAEEAHKGARGPVLLHRLGLPRAKRSFKQVSTDHHGVSITGFQRN